MLNEEKIRLMTKAAAYEKAEGKKNLKMAQYFRGDYISFQLVVSTICFVLAYGLCVGLYLFYRVEYLVANINSLDFAAMAKQAVIWFIIPYLVYMGLCYVYYSAKHKENKKSLAGYHRILTEISGFYSSEYRQEKEGAEAGGTEEHGGITGV